MSAIHFKDAINFIGKLSLRKLSNYGFVMSSYFLSKWLQKPIQWGMPFNISIEPTTSCNLECPECPSGLRAFTRPTGIMEEKLLDDILSKQAEDLIFMYFYFQGEPYLHPNFLGLVKKASDQKIYTTTSTNAHFLTERKAKETVESGLDRIIISIDGTTQETYESYRIGGKLDKVIQGTKNLVAAKKELHSPTPHIIFQFLVVKPNEHQIEEVKALGKEIGVDEVKLKTAQIYDYEDGNPLIPENDEYSRYRKKENGQYEIKNEMSNSCWKLWHSSVITWDGKVVPCCYDKDADHQLGDLSERNFKEIWENGKYTAFRKKITKSRKQIDICKNCSDGISVWR